jgi:hypothetical protein
MHLNAGRSMIVSTGFGWLRKFAFYQSLVTAGRTTRDRVAITIFELLAELLVPRKLPTLLASRPECVGHCSRPYSDADPFE